MFWGLVVPYYATVQVERLRLLQEMFLWNYLDFLFEQTYSPCRIYKRNFLLYSCFSAGSVLWLVFMWMLLAAQGRGRSGVETSSCPTGMWCWGTIVFHSVVFCVKFKFSWISKLIRQYLIIVLLQQLCMRWLGGEIVGTPRSPPSVETSVLSAILLTAFSAPSP